MKRSRLSVIVHCETVHMITSYLFFTSRRSARQKPSINLLSRRRGRVEKAKCLGCTLFFCHRETFASHLDVWAWHLHNCLNICKEHDVACVHTTPAALETMMMLCIASDGSERRPPVTRVGTSRGRDSGVRSIEASAPCGRPRPRGGSARLIGSYQ